MSLTSSTPSFLSSFLLPLIFVAPGVAVIAVAVALNWGR